MLLNEQIGSSQLGTVFLLHGVLITQDLIQRFETYPNFDSAPTTVIFGREALFLAPPPPNVSVRISSNLIMNLYVLDPGPHGYDRMKVLS